MNVSQYKNLIKQIVDSTDNELLLKHWEKQLQWDIKNLKGADLPDKEWKLVEEGIADYRNGNTMSLEDFLNKR